MSKYIVGISVDKVQTFLYEIIHAHVQEKQKETATLKNIKASSWNISNGFFKDIREAFAGLEAEELLACSGVYVLQYDAKEEDLIKRLDKLFIKYYEDSQGQKLLRYVCFPDIKNQYKENIEKIQEAKKRLKQSICLSGIIERNKEFLFSFKQIEGRMNELSTDSNKLPLFVDGINKLYSYEEQPEYEENHFRIAVIKADLDGMGDLFKEISDYGTYSSISKALDEVISLDGLHEAAETYQSKQKKPPKGCKYMTKSPAETYQSKQKKPEKPWIFPFYVAGDDIFFAVSVANLIKGVKLCHQMLMDVNKKVAELPTKFLSMSIGVEVVFNREPVRYYIERVEKQLKNAKEAQCPKILEKFLQTKISICDLAFLNLNDNLIKEVNKPYKDHKGHCTCAACKYKRKINKEKSSLPIWSHFLSDIKLLNHIKECEGYGGTIGSSSFFYSLLERINYEQVTIDDLKYSNNLFYHIMPEYLNSVNTLLRNAELLLMTKIIRQIYMKSTKEKVGDIICMTPKSKYRLESYLRLMLLFSDKRFHVTGLVKFKEASIKSLSKEDSKDITKYLFKKPRDYFYHVIEESDSALLSTLAKPDMRPMMKNGREVSNPYYKRVNIEKTMFFKMRDVKKFSVEKAAEMIQLSNPDDADAIKAKNEERARNETVAYHYYFNKSKFIQMASRSGKWTPDLIDSLMLFYEYNEMFIRFKGTMK